MARFARTRARRATATVLALLFAPACGGDDAESSPHDHGSHTHTHDVVDAGPLDNRTPPPDGSVIGAFQWALPGTFPRPPISLENPMSNEKVELGRHLFYDKRLSGNGT